MTPGATVRINQIKIPRGNKFGIPTPKCEASSATVLAFARTAAATTHVAFAMQISMDIREGKSDSRERRGGSIAASSDMRRRPSHRAWESWELSQPSRVKWRGGEKSEHYTCVNSLTNVAGCFLQEMEGNLSNGRFDG